MAKTQSKGPKSRGYGAGPRHKPSSSVNSSSYQKRHSKRDESPDVNTNDLYEYAPTKNRRANVKLNFDKEEIGGFRSGPPDDQNSDMEMDEIRERLAANMDAEFGIVGSDDDEELDSDAAFEGESDEERFANFKFASSVCCSIIFLHSTYTYTNVFLCAVIEKERQEACSNTI